YCIICSVIVFCVFFFSSRRRHTRSKRDWSSDVCSSDLRANCVYCNESKVSWGYRKRSKEPFKKRGIADLCEKGYFRVACFYIACFCCILYGSFKCATVY